MKLVASKVT